MHQLLHLDFRVRFVVELAHPNSFGWFNANGVIFTGHHLFKECMILLIQICNLLLVFCLFWVVDAEDFHEVVGWVAP